MFELDIPGFGPIGLEHLVSDYTGTLSVDGKLVPGVKDRLNKVSDFLKVHILTADTFGMAREELEGVNCEVHILEGADHDVKKADYVRKIGAGSVIALGNGANDRKMLKAARVGIAVCLQEGCSIDALTSGNILVNSALDALDLLLNPKRLKATLRY
jgi:soluble P-type ATPase